tara:strand:+ start:13358 stop:14794 length:1437 start_codon:yes stop_codon:yes gene_type:complete
VSIEAQNNNYGAGLVTRKCEFEMERPHPWKREYPSGCQFVVEDEETELVECDGKIYCLAHLPMLDASGEHTRKAGIASDAEELKKFNNLVFECIRKFEKYKADENIEHPDHWPMDLTGVVFPGEIHFEKRFHKTLPPCLFYGAEFNGNAFFQGMKFPRKVNFGLSVFKKYAIFGACEFHDGANFDGATFEGEANFNSSKSKHRFSAKNVLCRGRVRFDHCNFDGPLELSGSVFDNELWLYDGKFKDVLIEGGSAGENIIPLIDAHDTTFKEKLDCTNRIFSNPSNFRNSKFHKAPKFFGSDLHEGTSFEGAEFLDTASAWAIVSYRILRKMMEANRAWHDMGMFYSLEQKSIRTTSNVDVGIKSLSYLYDLSSEYGQSTVKPIIWLACLNVAFFLIYLIGGVIEAFATNTMINSKFLMDIIHYTLLQMVRPFDAVVHLGEQAHRAHVYLVPFAMIQSIVNIGLLAVFIVAVRRKFRIS